MLYKLNKDTDRENYSKVNRVTLADIGWKEKDLENLISNNIQDFISSNDLMTIFNERVRQEEPDILALDQNGDLYFFELKRWSGKQENLLQVLRYGQLFGKSNYDELNIMYQNYQNNKDVSLAEDHFRYFRVRGCVQIDVSQTYPMSVRRADIFNHVGRVRIMPEQHHKAPSGRKHLGKVTAVSGVGHPVSVVHVFLLQSRCPGFFVSFSMPLQRRFVNPKILWFRMHILWFVQIIEPAYSCAHT